MPKKLVVELFEEIYESPYLQINDRTAAFLRFQSASDLRRVAPTIRDFARFLAKSEYFNGKSFKSLATIFGVSVEAMAIRFEELNLVRL